MSRPILDASDLNTFGSWAVRDGKMLKKDDMRCLFKDEKGIVWDNIRVDQICGRNWHKLQPEKASLLSIKLFMSDKED